MVSLSKQGLVQVKAALEQKGWDKSSRRYLLSIAASNIIDSSENWEDR